ncbi:nitric oxide-sensing protein NosP [Denitrificimonas sp. JX-1]|uniref:Nitric oxide-sensing protein NosP n=1 Tax=Denitrificimonas halotolerans TaxID=3098930 RepID=A0ABU5GU44_9GAMM|nr:nitric oxide-sensing protein NosP [Denitrificimonas sp. JX-1]MDY7220324.1 nitric oxide-sensing protein NosP [Denitrificimonas sp. JX-1]
MGRQQFSLECEGVITAVSFAQQADEVGQDLARQLINPHLGFVLFFCSAQYDLPALSKALEGVFGGVPLLGCTTAGEISQEGYGRGCISAIGFDQRYFSMASVLVDEMERFTLYNAQELVEKLVNDCRMHAVAPIKNHSFALTLLDGLSSREEVVLGALSAALGCIPHFGGSAGDDNYFTRTHVYDNGQFYNGAAVVVLINTLLDFEVFTTHHLQPSTEKLVITKVDSDSRRVLELNAEPAALEYARLIGCSVAELDMHTFARYPLAVKISNSYYPRSIQQTHDDHSLTFYCAVENGIVLTAMQTTSLLDNVNQLFSGLNQRLGEPLITIGCDCFLRRLEIEHKDGQAAIEQVLKKQNVIGFNTYGEQFNGMHINQTFTGVAIGRAKYNAN